MLVALFFFVLLIQGGLSEDNYKPTESVDFLHRAPTSYEKLGDHVRETGMWRSKWFMYRDFYKDPDSSDEAFGKRDRLCIRFRPDRSIRVYSKAKRPLIQIGKKYWCGLGYGSEVDREKESIQEPKQRKSKKPRKLKQKDIKSKMAERLEQKGRDLRLQSKDIAEQAKRRKSRQLKQLERLFNVDGRYGTEIDPNDFHRVKMDIFELDEDGEEEKVRHEVSWEYGKTDFLSQRFVLGRVFRNPSKKDKKTRIGTYLVGLMSLSSNPHRPVLDKDFIAFQ